MIVELRVGGRYLDRFGNTWTVTEYHPGWTYPYGAFEKEAARAESYLPDGRWSNHTIAACDLVAPAPVLSPQETTA